MEHPAVAEDQRVALQLRRVVGCGQLRQLVLRRIAIVINDDGHLADGEASLAPVFHQAQVQVFVIHELAGVPLAVVQHVGHLRSGGQADQRAAQHSNRHRRYPTHHRTLLLVCVYRDATARTPSLE